MSLIVTGSIGIDTVHTPTDSAENVLGGSCTYFCAAASFFTKVRMVAVAGDDFTDDYKSVFEKFPNVCVEGLEIRKGSKTFRWGGKYLENWNDRETLFTELGVLEEHPPTPPAAYADSRFVFLANTHPAVQKQMVESFPKRVIAVVDTMNLWIDIARPELESLLDGTTNLNVAVREWADEVIFLHKIVKGGTDQSYGVHVARLAGVPRDVVNRAKELLPQLQAHLAQGLDMPELAQRAKAAAAQMNLFADPGLRVASEIKHTDLENMTPMQALDLLRKLKDEL